MIVNDVSVPHRPYYRPSIRFKARDGFCPIGPRVVARAAVADPDALAIRVVRRRRAARSRPAPPSWCGRSARLLADVTEFMTLAPGDVLAVGAAAPAPRVRAGQRVSIEIDGLGRLENRFVPGPRDEARPRRLRRGHPRGRAARSWPTGAAACASPTAAWSPRTRWSGCRRSRPARHRARPQLRRRTRRSWPSRRRRSRWCSSRVRAR